MKVPSDSFARSLSPNFRFPLWIKDFWPYTLCHTGDAPNRICAVIAFNHIHLLEHNHVEVKDLIKKKKKKDEWENMSVNREDDGGRARAQRNNRVRHRQLCRSLLRNIICVTIQRLQTNVHPPGPTPIEILEFWFLRNVYRSRVCVCVCVCRSGDNKKLFGSTTHS